LRDRARIDAHQGVFGHVALLQSVYTSLAYSNGFIVDAQRLQAILDAFNGGGSVSMPRLFRGFLFTTRQKEVAAWQLVNGVSTHVRFGNRANGTYKPCAQFFLMCAELASVFHMIIKSGCARARRRLHDACEGNQLAPLGLNQSFGCLQVEL
jgi:hypothetical protein